MARHPSREGFRQLHQWQHRKKGIELDVRLKLEVELLSEITRDRSEDNAKYTLVHRRNSALFGDSSLDLCFLYL